MKPINRITPLIIVPVLTLLVGFLIGTGYEQRMLHPALPGGNVASASGALLNNPQSQANMSVFWQVWNLLNTHYNYPDQINAQQMVYGATKGMVDSVGDPYTYFMTPQENQQFQDLLSGELQGIGAELTLKNGEVKVVSIIKGSPAEKAKLLPGDIITQVNKKTLENMSLNDIVMLIRGKKGTSVTLTVYRGTETQPRTFTIVRDTIQVPSVDYSVKQTATGSVGVLTINEFGDSTIREVQSALKDVPNQNLKGLIIDLRDNGGGYLDGAVSLVSMFVKEGKVVTVDSHDQGQEVHYVTGNPILPTIPLVVLVNGGTASASEITAGALQDNGRAKIIGTQTFGKGTVQEVLDLPDGSSLRVTIARWLTPKGRDLGKEGVTPDIQIDRTDADYEAGNDPQMTAALEWITEKKDITGGKKLPAATGATK
ncbi:MAG TPA: S41 family peptidase [Candidatus Peribacteraceae bacterium]|nr:S41 family peptidase [Candidatus Peribacteraceae bacterium]